MCFRCSQLCGSLENIWAALRRPESWPITMATSCWTPVKSLTVATCGVDSPSVSSACWSSERDQMTLASISVAQHTKTSSMVTTWTSRKCASSVSLQGDGKDCQWLCFYWKLDITAVKFWHWWWICYFTDRYNWFTVVRCCINPLMFVCLIFDSVHYYYYYYVWWVKHR